jgi:hypothetical protein
MDFDVTSISAIVAAAGVMIGVVLAVQELRHMAKSRRTESFWMVFSSFNSKEYLEAWAKVCSLEFKDVKDFQNKYGVMTFDNPIVVALSIVGNLFEGVEYLFQNGLIGWDAITQFPAGYTYEKVRPLVEGYRKMRPEWQGLWVGFERLAQELKKREQHK